MLFDAVQSIFLECLRAGDNGMHDRGVTFAFRVMQGERVPVLVHEEGDLALCLPCIQAGHPADGQGCILVVHTFAGLSHICMPKNSIRNILTADKVYDPIFRTYIRQGLVLCP